MCVILDFCTERFSILAHLYPALLLGSDGLGERAAFERAGGREPAGRPRDQAEPAWGRSALRQRPTDLQGRGEFPFLAGREVRAPL